MRKEEPSCLDEFIYENEYLMIFMYDNKFRIL